MKGRQALIFFLISIMSISLLVSCKSNTFHASHKNMEIKSENKIELIIAAAASLTDVLQEIGELYKTIDPETTINFTFGGSGALQAQIEEGAPVDIFISAAQKQMDTLKAGGHILDNTIKTLLVNKIVLITPKDTSTSIKSFQDLIEDEVDVIAIGDPNSVPVGQYSEEIFNNMNIIDKVDTKLVFANDVRTVLTWVESGQVSCGLVYKTDALTSDSINIVTEAPEGSHSEVTYPIGIVKDSKYLDKAQEFLDFLSTDEVISIFEKYGFSIK